ncbi:MAG: hypothetical protein U9R79_05325 [Armatimonadota bacterium]|nr:hypothetical protein [Armatimonadota bacterium]
MAGVTDNYGLATDVAVDDFVQPSHNNRLADTVDRVLGSVLRRLLTAGVYEGWSIQADKTVGPGQGLVAACWCETTAAEAISGLTDGAVNHVFLEATSDSPPEGDVSVFAQLSSSGPTDAIYLGTIELDGSGAVVTIDNHAEGVDRQCYSLAWRSVSGEGTEADVPAGEQVSFTITHEPLRVPGAISLESSSPDFTWEISETWRSDSFTVTVTNNGGSQADFEYTWTREGIAE